MPLSSRPILGVLALALSVSLAACGGGEGSAARISRHGPDEHADQRAAVQRGDECLSGLADLGRRDLRLAGVHRAAHRAEHGNAGAFDAVRDGGDRHDDVDDVPGDLHGHAACRRRLHGRLHRRQLVGRGLDHRRRDAGRCAHPEQHDARARRRDVGDVQREHVDRNDRDRPDRLQRDRRTSRSPRAAGPRRRPTASRRPAPGRARSPSTTAPSRSRKTSSSRARRRRTPSP